MHDGILRFEELCRGRGIPVTVQRRVVLEELLGSTSHPTADQIQRGVQGRIPGISQTTVYRVLELLVDLGLARKTCSPGTSCRYDGRTVRHHHLVCLSCDRIVDHDDPALNALPLPHRDDTGYELTEYSIQFLGTCSDCLSAHERTEKIPP
jgi:Fur family peroxide stress response transcriptional regulator